MQCTLIGSWQGGTAPPQAATDVSSGNAWLKHGRTLQLILQCAADMQRWALCKCPDLKVERHEPPPSMPACDHPHILTQDDRPRTPSGAEICRRYNFDRCTLGDECKFTHVCWKPGCGGPHPGKHTGPELLRAQTPLRHSQFER